MYGAWRFGGRLLTAPDEGRSVVALRPLPQRALLGHEVQQHKRAVRHCRDPALHVPAKGAGVGAGRKQLRRNRSRSRSQSQSPRKHSATQAYRSSHSPLRLRAEPAPGLEHPHRLRVGPRHALVRRSRMIKRFHVDHDRPCKHKQRRQALTSRVSHTCVRTWRRRWRLL